MDHFSWLSHFLPLGHWQEVIAAFFLSRFNLHVHVDLVPVAHFALITLVLSLFGLIVHARLRKTEKALVPDGKIGVASLFETSCESILGLMEGILGHHAARYFPLIGALFIGIFLTNFIGIIPGFLPPTDNINTTLAMGLIVFFYFNYVGIKTQGFIPYFKHFGGPIWWLAFLIFPIELFSTLIRPMSLALRLFGNMTGDHVVLGIFSKLAPLFVPIVFLGLGIFVSFIQAFVFSLLSTIYIGLSLPHEDH